ncbi:Amidohydrolase 1 [Moorella glycerini]|uniref:5-methylthioadenosine/S-adenosylhomocysteine deaminase n=1 Tax=Neomoorella stamsii TaxID=1266720 RepID=A0A9X7J4G7_9FIRM|nr:MULTISPECIES: amidohydrolase [Moorella]PRR76106.1 5-methylthioadenosine/S-adenosylhomocysteine deaminase [Moorella stamsii]CEP68288.1 Amidohydrolase 1 [Moorella glycerini]
MALIIRGGKVVTMDARQEILAEADIVINDDLIVGIYPKANVPPEYQAGQVLDAQGLIVLPGFCNAHSHVAMTMLRGMADDLPLKDWLEKRIWPAEEHLSREDVYWGALLGMTEMIRSGITSMADMYFYAEEVARASKEIGIRALIGRGIFNKIWDKSLAESLALYDAWQNQGEGRISVALAPHAPYSCTPNYLEKVAMLAADLKLPVHIHLAETRYEVEECQREYGLTPVALLDKVGILDYPVLAAHCVHLSPHDIDILARRRVLVAHNPISNAKLGSGIAPLKAL